MPDKIGRPLDEIHIAGEVPHCKFDIVIVTRSPSSPPCTVKEKLQFSMNRFFQRLSVDKPVARNNYAIQAVNPNPLSSGVHSVADTGGLSIGIVDPDELAWSESLNGPEDTFAHGRGNGTRDLQGLVPGSLLLRSERQTLRRLPRTGAIVFGIRTYQSRVADLVRERGVAARLASAVRSWQGDVAVYKGRKRWQDVLLPYLDESAACEGVRDPPENMLPYPY